MALRDKNRRKDFELQALETRRLLTTAVVQVVSGFQTLVICELPNNASLTVNRLSSGRSSD